MKKIHINYKILKKKNENFTLDVYYIAKNHGINQSYHITLKLENQQITGICPQFILL